MAVSPPLPNGSTDGLLLNARAARLMFTGAVAWCSAIFVADVLTGRHAVLIGLLVVGPACVLLTERWRPTAVAGVFAIGLAVICGVPDGIFNTTQHWMFMIAVTFATGVCTAAAARPRPQPL